MNKLSKLDELDIMLYAAMPYIPSKELEIYNNADPNIKLSNKEKKKILRRVERERKYAEHHQKYRPAWEAMKRVAAVVLIIMSIGFISVLSVEAVRDAIWKVITEWYEDSIFFAYVPEDDIAVPTMILEYKEPIVGDEFERYEAVRNDYNFSVEYESATTLITYQQDLLSEYKVWLSNHDTEMNSIDVNGHSGKSTVYEINGTLYNTIIWNDGVYVYTINGNIEIELLIDYAETIS